MRLRVCLYLFLSLLNTLSWNFARDLNDWLTRKNVSMKNKVINNTQYVYSKKKKKESFAFTLVSI